ncbi:MAG: hexose kinase [Planctomycetota bacterium]
MILCFGTSPTLQRTMIFDGGVVAGDVNRTTSVHDFASGKPMNAARVLRHIGRDVRLLVPLGGHRGQAYREDVATTGVALEAIDVAPPTRQCISVVDRRRRETTELVEEPAPLDRDVGEQMLNRLGELLKQTSVLVISGKLTPGLDEDLYLRAVMLAKGADVPVVLDARRAPLSVALEAGPTVVKPNRRELSNTVGRPVDSQSALHEAMDQLRQRGASWVVCTRGRDGSTLCGEQEGRVRFWDISTPHVEAVSPIGSGDAFAAGLAAGLSEDVDVPEACRFASACGAANAATASAGHLDPAVAQRLLQQVQVREIGKAS